ARRNDGGDDGDRQHAADQAVAAGAAVHDGGRHRQRVRGSRRSAPSQRARRDRPGALHDDARHQRHFARLHLVARPPAETQAQGSAGSGGSGGGVSRTAFRKMVSRLIVVLCIGSILLALVPLALILFYVVKLGFSSLNWAFFTHLPVPTGELGGGMANAIVGSLMVTGIGALFAVPIGVIAGIYTAEFRGTRLASATRFAADTLNGVPSIVIGVFAYAVAVLPFQQFSAMAGGFALGVMMLPLVMRTTEELLLLVPPSLREGALALGATRARAI